MTATTLITGASGQLGGLVLNALDSKLDNADIAVLVRKESDRERFAAQGYDVRMGDYSDPATLTTAFSGIERMLLISSSEVGQRVVQHQNVIEAAKAAGVGFVAYTSLLAADRSPMALAAEHKVTEEALAASAISHTILRNGWYSENLAMSAGSAIEMGQHFGAAGEGKFATATRQDYAQAAARALTDPSLDGQTFELAGDTAFTLSEFAATLSDIAGKPVAYVDLPKDDFAKALGGAGLPEPLADILADSDANARDGWLFEDSKSLSSLIGRPTTPIADVLSETLQAA